MLNALLKRLAYDQGLTVEQNAAYGLAQGCYISLCMAAGCHQMNIYVGKRAAEDDGQEESDTPAEAVVDFIRAQAAGDKRYGLLKRAKSLGGGKTLQPVATSRNGMFVQVSFVKPKGIPAFVEDVLPRIAPMTAPRTCCLCGQPISMESTALLLPDDAVAPAHGHCADEHLARAAQEPVKPNHTLLAILCALIGALIGAAVWAVVGVAGYIVGWVGLLIAFLACKGYELAHGRPGAVKLVTLLVCVILAVVVGTAGTTAWQIHEVYVEGVASLSQLDTPIPESEYFQLVIPNLLSDSDFLRSVGGNLFLGWLFAIGGSLGFLFSKHGKDRQPLVLSGGLGQ